jgi:hypothetical protein
MLGREVNTETTKYMLLSRHQNAGQNHDINIDNRYFENVAQDKFLRTTATNQNLTEERIKRRLISCNACNHSVQYSRPSSKNVKNYNMQNNNFACGSVWLRNLISEIKGETYTEGV